MRWHAERCHPQAEHRNARDRVTAVTLGADGTVHAICGRVMYCSDGESRCDSLPRSWLGAPQNCSDRRHARPSRASSRAALRPSAARRLRAPRPRSAESNERVADHSRRRSRRSCLRATVADRRDRYGEAHDRVDPLAAAVRRARRSSPSRTSASISTTASTSSASPARSRTRYAAIRAVRARSRSSSSATCTPT